MLLRAQGHGFRAIARELDRDPGTISRELRRNAASRAGKRESRAGVAQWKAPVAARRPRPAKPAGNPGSREYVQARLSGQLPVRAGPSWVPVLIAIVVGAVSIARGRPPSPAPPQTTGSPTSSHGVG